MFKFHFLDLFAVHSNISYEELMKGGSYSSINQCTVDIYFKVYEDEDRKC